CSSITHWHPGLCTSALRKENVASGPSRLKRIVKGIPVLPLLLVRGRELFRELFHLVKCFKIARSLDTLIIAGGGQLSELWRGPWSHPYNILKFSVLTKCANRKLIFLNVGAGPLDTFLSRVFVKYSIRMADYVSVRDVESRTLLCRIGA